VNAVGGSAPPPEVSDVVKFHVEKAVDALAEEFKDVHSRERIAELMEDSVRQLAGDSQVEDFIPALAHRFTRERLKAMARAHGPLDAEPDVLFIGRADTGRGQMAAALATLRSNGRVVAHSAGSTIGARLDPNVAEAMLELGVDLTEAYAKPLTPEVVAAADVVVTMGHSVGLVEIPSDKRHLDWRVGDPTGAPIDEVRRVRDEIDARVQTLLAELEESSASRSW
jgi:arsenate reductase (thioredoxin)